MSEGGLLLLVFGSFAVLLLARVPPLVVAQKVAVQLSDTTLLAIPFFILCGEIMSAGGMAARLIDLANVCVGAIRGGLAMVNVLASMFFGGISGSSVADTSSIGSLMIPMMVRKGYHRDFSVAVTVTSSTQGIIIPPTKSASSEMLYTSVQNARPERSRRFIRPMIWARKMGTISPCI